MELSTLNDLLAKCHSPNCGNEERREIESLLYRFDETPQSWSFYLGILTTSGTSDITCHFALSMLEAKVTKKWRLLSKEIRDGIRSGCGSLVQQLIDGTTHLTRQPYFSNKLLRLCADIARHDWPHEYPDFLDSVFQLCGSINTRQVCLGLIFLRTISEEFTDERGMCSTQRRAELKELLIRCLPQFRDIVVKVLGSWLSIVSNNDPSILEKENSVLEALSTLSHFCTWSPLHILFLDQTELVDLLGQVFTVGFAITSKPPNKEESKHQNCAQMVMLCLAEVFSRQRCLPKDSQAVLHVASMYFELSSRIIVPQLEMCKQSQDVLLYLDYWNSLLEASINCFSAFFSNCFAPLILNNPANHEGMLLSDLLTLLSRFSILQPELDNLCLCLEIWANLLDSLINTGNQTLLANAEPSVVNFIQQLLVRAMFTTNQRELDEMDDGDSPPSTGASITAIMKKTGFMNDFDFDSFNADGTRDSMVESQLIDGDSSDLPKAERFFICISSVIRNAAFCYPNAIICNGLLNATQQRSAMLAETVLHLSSEKILHSNVRAVDASRIHCISRDMATLVSLVAGVADLMDLNTGLSVFTSLAVLSVQSCNVVSQAEPVELGEGNSPLREDLIRLHSRLFASMHAVFVHLVRPVLVGNISRPQTTTDEVAQQLLHSVDQVIDASVNLMAQSKVSEVLQGLIPFLYACLTCRIPSISNCQKFEILKQILKEKAHFDANIRIQLTTGLCASIFLPHAEQRDNQQNWPNRSVVLQQFFMSAIFPYCDISNVLLDPNRQHVESLKNVLRMQIAICRLVSTESTNSRQLVVSCIINGPVLINGQQQPFLKASLPLLHQWQSSGSVEELLTLVAFLSSVVGLQSQISSEHMNELIQTVMNTFPPHLLVASLSGCDQQPINSQLVVAFLSFLRHVFEKGDSVSNYSQRKNRQFLESTIQFCIADLRPVVTSGTPSAISVLPAYISLLETSISDNWHFFSRKFGSSSGLGNLIDDIDRLEQANFPALISIIETLFSIFVLPDVEVARRAVSALNKIDAKCRLFSRNFFSSNFGIISSVTTTLLYALQTGAHDLLRDEILLMLHSVLEKAQIKLIPNTPATSGFSFFFRSVLPSFANSQIPGIPLSELLPGFEENTPLAVDQPTFTANMLVFIQNLRYHVAVQAVTQSTPPMPGQGWLISALQQGHQSP